MRTKKCCVKLQSEFSSPVVLSGENNWGGGLDASTSGETANERPTFSLCVPGAFFMDDNNQDEGSDKFKNNSDLDWTFPFKWLFFWMFLALLFGVVSFFVALLTSPTPNLK
jgi:hypothetical protein